MIFNPKKKHYKEKMRKVQARVWDLEFLLSKIRLMREDFRREYDRQMEKVDALTQYRHLIQAFGMEKAKEIQKQGPELGKERLKGSLPKAILPKDDQEAVDNIAKRIEESNIDITQLKKQMEGCDHQIEETFSKPGDGGILGTIDGYETVIDLLKKEIKRL